MAKVKICGLQRRLDVEAANQAGPDYIGFVFAESRRRVTLKEAVRLAAYTDPRIGKVGVFVNAPIDDVVETAKMVPLDVVQLHGDENQEYIAELHRKLSESSKIWLKIGMPERETGSFKDGGANLPDRGQDIPDGVDALLLDTMTGKQAGGTGKTFDWRLAQELCRSHKVIIAGGLNSDNVQEAITLLNPSGVDVSTCVETDGYKDKVKMALFVQRVREVRNSDE